MPVSNFVILECIRSDAIVHYNPEVSGLEKLGFLIGIVLMKSVMQRDFCRNINMM